MGDVGVSRPEKKAKGKGVQPPADAHPSEDTFTIGHMVSKAKAAESKPKVDSKQDSHQSKTQTYGFSFVFAIFCNGLVLLDVIFVFII